MPRLQGGQDKEDASVSGSFWAASNKWHAACTWAGGFGGFVSQGREAIGEKACFQACRLALRLIWHAGDARGRGSQGYHDWTTNTARLVQCATRVCRELGLRPGVPTIRPFGRDNHHGGVRSLLRESATRGPCVSAFRLSPRGNLSQVMAE
jgi:hypothetical protein